MRNGPIIVVLLILAAAFGAWLGPAGERVDPELAPMEAYFKYAIKTRLAPRKVEHIYLAVRGQDPPAALMQRFFGDIRPIAQRSGSDGATVELTSLDFLSEDTVRCVGSTSLPAGSAVSLTATLSRSPRGQWESR